MSNARSVAVKVLGNIERFGSYSNLAIDSAIREAGVDKKDASLASLLVYGVLARKLSLDYCISLCSDNKKKIHPFVLSVLRVGLYQLIFMDRIPESAAVNESVALVKRSRQSFAVGFVNALLRKAAREKDDIKKQLEDQPPNIRYSCSKEFYNELSSEYSDTVASQFLEASLIAPKTYARVNTLKIAPSELFSKMSDYKVTVESEGSEPHFCLCNAGDIKSVVGFDEGLFYIQDLASQLMIKSIGIKHGMDVLDVCSAPGGKSFTAAMYLEGKGHITACDVYEKRVGLIRTGAKRLGIDNLSAVVNDALVFNEKLGVYDVVICDVPCSGLGVIRRKPEIKYRPLSEYANLTEVQLNILKTSSRYVKNNGKLIYSTCTVRKSENRNIVNNFLKINTDFSIVSENTLMPQTHGTDGFYYCIMERK